MKLDALANLLLAAPGVSVDLTLALTAVELPPRRAFFAMSPITVLFNRFAELESGTTGFVQAGHWDVMRATG